MSLLNGRGWRNPRDHSPTWLMTGDVRPRELRSLITATQSGADMGLRTKLSLLPSFSHPRASQSGRKQDLEVVREGYWNSVSTLLRNSTDTSVPLQSSYSVGIHVIWGFPGGSEVKASAYNVRNLGSIPGWGRSPGEENGNPLQYSCLENPMDGGAWWATVHGVTKSRHDRATSVQFMSFCSNLFHDCLWPCTRSCLEYWASAPILAHLNPILVFGEYL